ncbi:hypothetical protein DFJ74DRAFT_604677 [Hyaloraphidium curvatum]|nr:hypothetical protein DFJ74DRAFT_604677 [Hyaloraphidium curvatum]
MATGDVLWHSGEIAVQRQLLGAAAKLPSARPNPTSRGFPLGYAPRVSQSPLIALGVVDAAGRPWTTVLGGFAGAARAVAPGALGISSGTGAEDPVVGVLLSRAMEVDDDGTRVVRNAGPVAGLTIDPETRDRVKFAGSVLIAAFAPPSSIELGVRITEMMGNCPKYINRKRIVAREPQPELVSSSLPLPEAAIDLLARADTFFMTSTDSRDSIDTNHRGGPPGFVRVARNDGAGCTLVYPEYSGNRLYQSLGNIRINPNVGIVFPDFATGDALFVSGTAEILAGGPALALLPRAKLALRIEVTAARFIRSCLPFTGEALDPSPYNPPVRRLASELPDGLDAAAASGSPSLAKAALVLREELSPGVARLTFALTAPPGAAKPSWTPGDHATFDFGPELDRGYSHMRDWDPQSLNDDFVRTFTVSGGDPGSGTLVVTARHKGPATSLLFSAGTSGGLSLPIVGFAGSERFRMAELGSGARAVFVAGGVGITPLLAQAPGLLAAGRDFRLVWGLAAEDLGLARDSFDKIPGLAARSALFVSRVGDGEHGSVVTAIEGAGAAVHRRRMGKEDLVGEADEAFFVCAGPAMTKAVTEWLADRDVRTESFAY